MSFADLERGLGQRAPLINQSTDSDSHFKTTARHLSIQIHKINANVSAVLKLVDLLGSSKDTPDLRNKLHGLTDVTRELVKDSTGQIKDLAKLQLSSDQRQLKLERDKISADFTKSLRAFQTAQTTSVERQRTFVQRAKANLDDQSLALLSPSETLGLERGQLLELSDQSQLMEQEQQVHDSEIEFQEQLIQEREGEIEEIEQGITELNEIFRDLATIVSDQGSMINNIESNVISVANNTRNASEELVTANNYQRKAARRMTCLLMVFVVVFMIVLLAVLS